MKPSVLVTKRIFPEAIEYLKEHCEVDYEENDDGLPSDQLLPRLRGKQAILANLTNKFTPEFIDSLDGLKIIANVSVTSFDMCALWFLSSPSCACAKDNDWQHSSY